MSLGNPSATPRALFADRIIAQEEFAAKVVQEECAAKAEAAADRALRMGVAQGGGELRSIEDQELDGYSPHTSESEAFEVMNRVKSMMKVLNNTVDNQEVGEEFAAKAQAAADRALKKNIAKDSGGLRSIEDQDLDSYSPDTSESDAFEVMNRRVKSMVNKLGWGSQPKVFA